MQIGHRAQGITLIELTVTVAVLGILAAFAIPSFRSLMNTNRVATLTNELVAALNFARSEAIKRGIPVTVCKTANPDTTNPTCTTSGGWQTGWLVFTDKMGALGSVDEPDSLHPGDSQYNDVRLRIKQPTGGNGTISGNGNVSNFVSYLPGGDGRGNGGGLINGTLTVCVGGYKRDIVINSTGRIRIAKGTCS